MFFWRSRNERTISKRLPSDSGRRAVNEAAVGGWFFFGKATFGPLPTAGAFVVGAVLLLEGLEGFSAGARFFSGCGLFIPLGRAAAQVSDQSGQERKEDDEDDKLSLIHISEPTRRTPISY